jgi:hypothetical protein
VQSIPGARIGYCGYLMHLLSVSTCYICSVAASRIVAPSPRPGVIVSSKKNLLPKGDNTFLYAESKRARVSSVTFRAMSRRIVPCRTVPCHTVPCLAPVPHRPMPYCALPQRPGRDRGVTCHVTPSRPIPSVAFRRHFRSRCESVFRIRDILVQIRILGSVSFD